MDLDKGYMEFGFLVKQLNVTSDYDMSGRILKLYLNATGDDYITMSKLSIFLKRKPPCLSRKEVIML